jgi:O-antigen/teichoic acid export membrane protein
MFLTALNKNLKEKILSVLNHQGFRRYSINTAWLFSEQILRMVAGFFVGVWVARYLGPEKFGIFSYALAFVSIFQGIAKLGLDGILVRDLVKESEKKDIYLGTSFWLKFFAGIIIFIIVLIVSYFASDNLQTFIYINIISAGLIFQSFEVIDFYYQATVQAKYISIRKMIQLFLSSIIKIILVLVKADLIWFVLVTLFDSISLAVFSWWIYKSQRLPNFIKYFKWNTAKRLLNDSWPLVLSSMAIAVYMRIDQVMIKNMLGDREVGLYSAAVKLVEIWYFIPMIITQSVFPAIVNAKKISEELYYERLQQLLSLLIWIAISLALIICLLSKHIIYFLYGGRFIEASPALAISVWASLFEFIGVGTSQWFLTENLQNLSFFRTLYGAIINIVLNLILIPFFGIIGASISTILSYSIAVYLSLLFNKKTIKIFRITSIALLYPKLSLQN